MRIVLVGLIVGDRLSIRLAYRQEGEQRTQSRVFQTFLDQLVTDSVRLYAKKSETWGGDSREALHTSRTDRVSTSVVACEIVQSKIETKVVLRRTIGRAGIQVAYITSLTEKRTRSLANSRRLRKRQLESCRSP